MSSIVGWLKICKILLLFFKPSLYLNPALHTPFMVGLQVTNQSTQLYSSCIKLLYSQLVLYFVTGLCYVTDVAHSRNAASRFDYGQADKLCNKVGKQYHGRSKVCGKTKQLQSAVTRVCSKAADCCQVS